MAETFGEKIRKLRESISLSRQELSSKIHIDVSWISRIESNLAVPSITIATRLAQALGANEEEFKKWALEDKLKKEKEKQKKRDLVYHSPLSADEIESILQEEEKRIDNLFEKEVINKRRLEEIGLAAAGPVKLDFKTKKAILEQLRILIKENKRPK